jgi:predicted small metal-binding protein
VKTFRCGDVVPGCDAAFSGTDADIEAAVADHARASHGLTEIPPELVSAVRANTHAAG